VSGDAQGLRPQGARPPMAFRRGDLLGQGEAAARTPAQLVGVRWPRTAATFGEGRTGVVTGSKTTGARRAAAVSRSTAATTTPALREVRPFKPGRKNRQNQTSRRGPQSARRRRTTGPSATAGVALGALSGGQRRSTTTSGEVNQAQIDSRRRRLRSSRRAFAAAAIASRMGAPASADNIRSRRARFARAGQSQGPGADGA